MVNVGMHTQRPPATQAPAICKNGSDKAELAVAGTFLRFSFSVETPENLKIQ
jgi:hypothetical protein